MKKLVFATSLAVLLAGCSTQTYIVSEQHGSQTPTYDKMQHFFVSGLGQQQEKNASEVCGAGNTTKIQTKQSFLNGLLGNISYGIYTPRDLIVYCK